MLSLMDNFFDDFRPLSPVFSRSSGVNPAVNIKEYKDRFEIKLTAPGIDPEKIKIELSERILNISYVQEDSQEEKEEGELIRQEYHHYSFSRSIALPKNVDEDSILAETDHGILKITVKKLPETQPKKVEIKVKK